MQILWLFPEQRKRSSSEVKTNESQDIVQEVVPKTDGNTEWMNIGRMASIRQIKECHFVQWIAGSILPKGVAVLAKPRQFLPGICGREEKTMEHRKTAKQARD